MLLGWAGERHPGSHSAALGFGSAGRLSKVRWHVSRDSGVAWLTIIPVSALCAANVKLRELVRHLSNYAD